MISVSVIGDYSSGVSTIFSTVAIVATMRHIILAALTLLLPIVFMMRIGLTAKILILFDSDNLTYFATVCTSPMFYYK
jgi:hypothetical protein